MNGEQVKLQNTPVIPRDVALRAVNPAKWYEWKGRQACIASARAKPLPGAAGPAFTSGNISAGGKTVYRVVPAHFAVLQALESPLLAMIDAAMNKGETKADFNHLQQWEICYVFTMDARKAYEQLEAGGVEAIRKAAKEEVGLVWEPGAVNLVILAVLEQIKRHVQTTVKFAAEMEKEGQISFFRESPESR
jgi:hypothetical protein